MSKRSDDIEKEILKEISCGQMLIPWCYKVEKVKVIEKGKP
ncbi:MAG: hypothetical protein QHH24_04005 [Candidatus Bathyarchaeota archaeon]|nr:hypothetical protein [Candidatus Bathyarchaeota archaeon]